MRIQMNKIALAVAATLPLIAQAADPAELDIYGRLDIGPLYQSNPTDGVSVKLQEISANRLGFQGEKKFGDGISAFYRLEHRFNLNDGTERSGKRFWTDKAWVGLRSEQLGAIWAGRVLTVGNTIVGGGDFEAMTDSIGSVNSRKGRIENNIDKGIFYESPWFEPSGGAKIRGVAQVTVPGEANAMNPYGLGMQFRQGKFKFDAGYQHDVSKDGSAQALEDRKSNSVFTGVAYDFGTHILKGTFASSRGYKGNLSDYSKYRMQSVSVSFNKTIGKWDLGLMANHKTETNTSGVEQPDITKVAAGYWYNLDKKTKIMPTIAYERLSGAGYKAGTNGYGTKKNEKDNLYIQLGVRHEF